MSKRRPRKALSSRDILDELAKRFASLVAVGLLHGETTEAGLATISPKERNQLKTKIDNIGGVPVNPSLPRPKRKKKTHK